MGGASREEWQPPGGAFWAGSWHPLAVPLTVRDPEDGTMVDEVVGTEKLVLGGKSDPATDIGPLVDETAADRVEAWGAEALAAGATVRTGVKRDGTYPWPTVLTDVPAGARVLTEEVFGPVVSIQAYDDLDGAVAEGQRLRLRPASRGVHQRHRRRTGDRPETAGRGDGDDQMKAATSGWTRCPSAEASAPGSVARACRSRSTP